MNSGLKARIEKLEQSQEASAPMLFEIKSVFLLDLLTSKGSNVRHDAAGRHWLEIGKGDRT